MKLHIMKEKQFHLESLQDILDFKSHPNLLNTEVTSDESCGLQIQPRNQDAVVIVKTFTIH